MAVLLWRGVIRGHRIIHKCIPKKGVSVKARAVELLAASPGVSQGRHLLSCPSPLSSVPAPVSPGGGALCPLRFPELGHSALPRSHTSHYRTTFIPCLGRAWPRTRCLGCLWQPRNALCLRRASSEPVGGPPAPQVAGSVPQCSAPFIISNLTSAMVSFSRRIFFFLFQDLSPYNTVASKEEMCVIPQAIDWGDTPQIDDGGEVNG